MTRFPHASRDLRIVVACAAVMVIVITAVLWIPRRSGETGLARESSQKQDGSSNAHSAVLTWKASSSSVVGYNVYRCEDPRGPYQKLNSRPIRETTYTDFAVQSGHAYFYMVKSVDAHGRESVFSNQVRATVPSS